MKVRPADRVKDAEAIIAGVCDFVQERMNQDLIPADTGFLAAIGRELIVRDDIDILLAENDGGIVGGIAFAYAPYPWNPALLMAEELAFWCRRDAPPKTVPGLLGFAEKTARDRPADLMIMHSLAFCAEGFGNVLCRLGYQPLQSSFARRL